MGFRKKNTKSAAPIEQDADVIPGFGDQLNFPVKEAINLLRTNLSLSFTDTEGARMIGVTSSVRGEGKSFVSVNLAHSLAEMKYKVLLLEGDLRLPTISKKLQLNKTPGLSNYLTGKLKDLEAVTQHHPSGKFDVITSGDIPPNPSEMLGSRHIKKLLDVLAEMYDYIIMDLPPITAVPDALVVSKLINGFILVVRHEYCDKSAIQETIRQLKMANSNILGFVYNDNSTNSGVYSKKYYRKNKYKRYYSKAYYGSYGERPSEKEEK